ncbi:hypothetical protein GQ42DRAFT_76757 [Ramicandelaber brevisporus]|nr:hypothetical protein GQ42DRAFT_76757 [Ramicandelaber brevisporus]
MDYSLILSMSKSAAYTPTMLSASSSLTSPLYKLQHQLPTPPSSQASTPAMPLDVPKRLGSSSYYYQNPYQQLQPQYQDIPLHPHLQPILYNPAHSHQQRASTQYTHRRTRSKSNTTPHTPLSPLDIPFRERDASHASYASSGQHSAHTPHSHHMTGLPLSPDDPFVRYRQREASPFVADYLEQDRTTPDCGAEWNVEFSQMHGRNLLKPYYEQLPDIAIERMLHQVDLHAATRSASVPVTNSNGTSTTPKKNKHHSHVDVLSVQSCFPGLDYIVLEEYYNCLKVNGKLKNQTTAAAGRDILPNRVWCMKCDAPSKTWMCSICADFMKNW